MSVDLGIVPPVPEAGGPAALSSIRSGRFARRTAAGAPRQTAFLLAAGLLSAFVILALAAPLLTAGAVYAQHLRGILQSPSIAHPFGTDELGRDILARTIYGSRISLLTAALATFIAVVAGIPIGLAAGFFAGKTDAVLMRAMDVLLSIPAVVLAMTMIAVLGTGTFNAIYAIGIIGIPSIARLTRAGVLAERDAEYVVGTRALGASRRYILLRTILPNISSPIIAQMAITAEIAILLQAALSFLGLGTPPPTPTWGQMLSDSQSFLAQAPWYGLFPGIVLTITVLCLDIVARRAGTTTARGIR
ncbi:MAG: ABC transporter permease [Acidimicrobiales bacterium]